MKTQNILSIISVVTAVLSLIYALKLKSELNKIPSYDEQIEQKIATALTLQKQELRAEIEEQVLSQVNIDKQVKAALRNREIEHVKALLPFVKKLVANTGMDLNQDVDEVDTYRELVNPILLLIRDLSS